MRSSHPAGHRGSQPQGRQYRKELRDLCCSGACPAKTASSPFILKEETPAGAKDDGRTWRIKVGNSPLKLEELTMMGGGAVVGEIPKGLPSFSLPPLDPRAISHLLASAIIISLLGFMEAISIAKAMAAKTGQRLDPNQELIGQGLANIVGSMTNAYPDPAPFPAPPSTSRPGRSPGFPVFLPVHRRHRPALFHPLLYHLPQSVLAAVIMMAVIGLINASGFIHAWKAQKIRRRHLGLLLSHDPGLRPPSRQGHHDRRGVVACRLSLQEHAPQRLDAVTHRDDALKNSVVHGLKECQYIDMIRFEGPLFFANASYLEDQITERMENKKSLKHIVIVANGMNDIDASGEEVLSLVVSTVRSAGSTSLFQGSTSR
jgi:sulfate permease, SulP family